MRTFTAEDLQRAFDRAEIETSAHYAGKTCSMLDGRGTMSCPLCHFRVRVKIALGIRPEPPAEAALTPGPVRAHDESAKEAG